MAGLIIDSMQWSKLAHIQDVTPINDADAPCLLEIREVLERHNRLGRFGVSLLHNHFAIDADEIMMESTNVHTREQIVRPVKRAELEAEGITFTTTVVTFDDKGYNQVCGCNPRSTGHHHL